MFHTSMVLASLGGGKYIVLSIFLPCENAFFTFIVVIFRFCEAISGNIDLTVI